MLVILLQSKCISGEGVGEGRRMVVDSVDVTENPGYIYTCIFNPRRACAARVTVVVVFVCHSFILSVM